jgi:hypothetical protein
MASRPLGLLLLALMLFGCSSGPVDSDSEQRAENHMSQARMLEATGRWNEAASEYALVAQLYGHTTYYEDAVKKAALLYDHPDNASWNDSTAIHWLRQYATLTLPSTERLALDILLRTNRELRDLRAELNRQIVLNDSLRDRESEWEEELASRSAKIRDLEREVQKLNDELKRLREIDIKFGRSREEQ